MRINRVLVRSPRAAIDLKNAVIKIKGANVGEVVTVVLGTGNLTYEEKRNIEYIRDRGLLDTVREGDEEPVDVRLDSTWESLTGGAGAPTVEDALKRRGAASSWHTTSADVCEPYAVDIEITISPPCGSAGQEVILIQDFRWESANHDMRGATLAFAGKANVKEATVTRSGGGS